MKLEIDTPAKRSRITARKNPYWTGISGGRGGTSLGYRKVNRGAGAWIAKVIVEGRRAEERLGLADDSPAADGSLSYPAAVAAALEWSSRQLATWETAGEGSQFSRPTVRTAVEVYVKARAARSKQDGKNAEGRLGRHVLSDTEFADTQLAKLRSGGIEKWRDALTDRETDGALAPATINRLLNDLRAALNLSALKYRRELPAHLVQEIRIGTKAIEAATQARQQLLTDDQVRALVGASFEVEDTGDFGRLVTTIAASGARFSQAARLAVGDLQPEQARVMMPSSRKGRGRRMKPPAAIQLTADTVEALRPAFEGRNDPTAPLLERWYHRKTGRSTWVRESRRAWGRSYDIEPHWSRAVAAAGLPAGTIMYSLRHSSIVRGLRAMLPIRLVAALHDTSSEMIETHYSAFIVDATEDLARKASISLPAKPSVNLIG